MKHTSETQFLCEDPAGLIDFWRAEFAEHDLSIKKDKLDEICGSAEGMQLTIVARKDGCRIVVDCQDAAWLPDFRGHVEEHVAEFNPKLVPLVWSGSEKAGQLPPSFALATVATCEPLGVSWWRMSLRVDPTALKRFGGEHWHFRLLRPGSAGQEPVWPRTNARGTIDWPKGEDALLDRVFTSRIIDEAHCLLTFDIFRHDGGPTCDWAASQPSEETVGIMGPGGKGGPDAEAKDYLIAGGDETAVPAILRGLDDLSPDCDSSVVLLVKNEADCQPVPDQVAVHWLFRDEGAAEEDLVREICGVSLQPERSARLWFAASQDAVRTVRNHGRDVLQLPRHRLAATAYWS